MHQIGHSPRRAPQIFCTLMRGPFFARSHSGETASRVRALAVHTTDDAGPEQRAAHGRGVLARGSKVFSKRVFLLLCVSLIAALSGGANGCEPDPIFQIMAPDFLTSSGIQAELDAGRNNRARIHLVTHFRERLTPTYFPDFMGEQPDPDEGYNTDVAEDILEHRIVVRYFQDPHQFPDPMNWTAGLDFEELNVLNRHHFVDTLSQAYWFTGDVRYLQKCMALMRDWRAHTPPPYGAAYRGLETAVRAINWVNALYRFRGSADFTDSDLLFVLTVLNEHGPILRADTRTGNHGTQAQQGLAYLGIMFPEFTAGAEWRTHALARMTSLVDGDIYADGMQREISPGYHTNVIVQVTTVERLANLNAIPIGDLSPKLESMHDAILKISKPNKRVPLLNDSGSGLYSTAWLSWGALAYNRPDFKFMAGIGIAFNAATLGGLTQAELDAYAAMPSTPPAFTSVALPNSGLYAMRSGWNAADRYMLFDRGVSGGYHTHDDKMNIDLYAFGRSMIVDPGQCNYTDPVSGAMRQTGAHNVVTINDSTASGEVTNFRWVTGNAADIAQGESLIGSRRWRRTALFIKPSYWIINDVIDGERLNQTRIDQRWHYLTPESVTIDPVAKQVDLRYTPIWGANGNLLLKWPALTPLTFDSRVANSGDPYAYLTGDFAVSPDASGKSPADYLVVRQSPPSPAVYSTVAYPYTGATPSIAVTSERADTDVAIHVTRGAYDEVVIINDSPNSLLMGTSFNGRVALSQYGSGQLYRVDLHGGTYFENESVRISRATDFGDVAVIWYLGVTLIDPPTPGLVITLK